MSNNKPFAEVIESSLRGFTAQCWEANMVPKFGSLVMVEQENAHPRTTIIGLVHSIKTGSADPARHITPYKKTHEQLRKEHPQIFAFLKTTLSCCVLGYGQSGKIQYQLAPKPVSVHSFVTPITPEVGKLFFSSTLFMHLLFHAVDEFFNIDDVIVALVQYAVTQKFCKTSFLQDTIEQFSLLSGNDYQRLRLFVQRIS